MRRFLFLSRRTLKPVFVVTAVIAVLVFIIVHLISHDYAYVETLKEQTKQYLDNFPPQNQVTENILKTNGSYFDSESVMDEELRSIFNRLEKPLVDGAENFTPLEIKNLAKEREELYQSVVKTPITEPKLDNLVRPGDELAGQANATILSLARNKDLRDIQKSIRLLEEKFNSKYGYPYIFLNDEEFNEEFKEGIKAILPEDRHAEFGKIEPDMWEMPGSVDRGHYESAMKEMASKGVAYADWESYHNMCRFYSRGFYHHPLLQKYKYTWRVEPNVEFFCNQDYDVFQFMEMNDKIYGYVLNVYDSPDSVKSLWTRTMEFVQENPQYLNRNGAFEWLKDNGVKPEGYAITQGYSTCHFWTNFEILNLDFLRSEVYEAYMDFLEEQGGFYYERWGDAPVRSVALGLFADKSKIHWFRDIAYSHMPYTNCPTCPEGSTKCSGCEPGKFCPWSDLNIENCQAVWIKHVMTQQELDMY